MTQTSGSADRTSDDPRVEPASRRLKIAYVADIVRDTGVGAVQSSVRFIKGLREHHDVTIIATDEGDVDRYEVPALYIPGLQWIIDKNGFNLAGTGREILRKVLPGHDIVYVHYTLLLGYFAVREARKLDIPVVFGFHFQPQNILYNLHCNTRWLNNLLLRFFNNAYYNLADHVIAPSEPALKELLGGGFTGTATVISNGFPAHFHRYDVTRPDDQRDDFIVLMVGRLSREKRHDLVIEAIKRSKHAQRIRFIATGHGPVLDDVQQRAASLNKPSEVGFVTQERLIELYNTADLLIHASEAELEGMAVLEAIGCGLPALIARSEHSASSQFALDERFLFSGGDINDLVAKLDYLIEHPAELEAASAGYESLALGYRYDTALQQMEQTLLRTAMSQPRPADDAAFGYRKHTAKD